MTNSSRLTSAILPLTVTESPGRSVEMSWTVVAITRAPEPTSLKMQCQRPPEGLRGKSCTVACQPGSRVQRPRYSSSADSRNREGSVIPFRWPRISAADFSRIVGRSSASAGVDLSEVRSGAGALGCCRANSRFSSSAAAMRSGSKRAIWIPAPRRRNSPRPRILSFGSSRLLKNADRKQNISSRCSSASISVVREFGGAGVPPSR
jgi:hypothetical protein